VAIEILQKLQTISGHFTIVFSAFVENSISVASLTSSAKQFYQASFALPRNWFASEGQRVSLET